MTRQRRFAQRWTDFWFGKQPTLVLAIVRIATGCALLLTRSRVYGILSRGADPARLPIDQFHLAASYHIDPQLYVLPYVSWLVVPSYTIHAALETALFVCVFASTIGLLTRLTTASACLIIASLFFSSQLYYHHHLYLYLLCFGLLAISPCGEQLSVDRWRKGAGATPVTMTRHPAVRLFQVLVSCIYLFNAISKTTPEWFSGRVIEHLLALQTIQGHLMEGAVGALPSWLLGSGVVATEYFLAVGFWWPRTRLLAVALGVALHLGIMSAMYVSSFSVQMLSLYVFFFFRPGMPTRAASPRLSRRA